MSNGPAFFQTGMGHKYYESTLPRLVEQLDRCASAQERLVHSFDRLAGLVEQLTVATESLVAAVDAACKT